MRNAVTYLRHVVETGVTLVMAGMRKRDVVSAREMKVAVSNCTCSSSAKANAELQSCRSRST
jgi:hypothetical protein